MFLAPLAYFRDAANSQTLAIKFMSTDLLLPTGTMASTTKKLDPNRNRERKLTGFPLVYVTCNLSIYFFNGNKVFTYYPKQKKTQNERVLLRLDILWPISVTFLNSFL